MYKAHYLLLQLHASDAQASSRRMSHTAPGDPHPSSFSLSLSLPLSLPPWFIYWFCSCFLSVHALFVHGNIVNPLRIAFYIFGLSPDFLLIIYVVLTQHYPPLCMSPNVLPPVTLLASFSFCCCFFPSTHAYKHFPCIRDPSSTWICSLAIPQTVSLTYWRWAALLTVALLLSKTAFFKLNIQRGLFKLGSMFPCLTTENQWHTTLLRVLLCYIVSWVH